jgi:hypothetical protein
VAQAGVRVGDGDTTVSRSTPARSAIALIVVFAVGAMAHESGLDVDLDQSGQICQQFSVRVG